MSAPREGSTWGRWLLAIVASLAALAAIDGADLWTGTLFQLDRADTARPTRNALVFAGVYLAAAGSLLACILHRSPWVAGTIALWTSLAVAIELGLRGVVGNGLGHHEASLLVTEYAFLGDATRFFSSAWVGPALAGFVGGIATSLALRWLGPRTGSVFPVLALAASVALAFTTVTRTFGKVYEFPIPVRLPTLVAWAANNTAPFYGEREAPRFQPSVPPLAEHVVLVVDESVSAQFFDAATTPWLASRPRGTFDYGAASAVSNLSSISNLVMQSGLRQDQFPDTELRTLKSPNIFSYFERAGFETALIDSQTYGDKAPNGMTGFDLAGIDVHLRLRELRPSQPEYAYDFEAIRDVTELVEGSTRSFTYLLKTGAHFPYLDKAPPDERPFQPTSKTGAIGRDPDRIRNDYRNAIRWTTDRFLEELLAALERTERDVVVLYTSDHGQSLEAAFDSKRFTPHATAIDPPSEQALVPLVLLAAGERARTLLTDRHLPARYDSVSAFEIFPTLLYFAGYHDPAVTLTHGPHMFDAGAERPERVFLSGNVYGGASGMLVLNPRIDDAGGINRFKWSRPGSAD